MGLFLIERYERSMKDILPQNFYRLMEKLFQKDRPTMEIKILLRAFALGLSQILLVCATAFTCSMLPGFADFNAKNNKKNLHDCNE